MGMSTPFFFYLIFLPSNQFIIVINNIFCIVMLIRKVEKDEIRIARTAPCLRHCVLHQSPGSPLPLDDDTHHNQDTKQEKQVNIFC